MIPASWPRDDPGTNRLLEIDRDASLGDPAK